MTQIRKLQRTVTFNGEAIQFTGDNGEEILKWITEKGFNSNGLEHPIYRPKSVPNLPWSELLEWWAASGEIKEDVNPRTGKVERYNTHTQFNCPAWKQDEIMEIPICDYSQGKGYVKYERFKKGGWLVFTEGDDYDSMAFYEKFPEYIDFKVVEEKEK